MLAGCGYAFLSHDAGVCRNAISLYPYTPTDQQVLPMMPMYYLHIRDGDKLEVDPDGTELPDLEAARVDALKVAQELINEVPDLGCEEVIEIADGDGHPLLSVPFDAIRPKHQSETGGAARST